MKKTLSVILSFVLLLSCVNVAPLYVQASGDGVINLEDKDGSEVNLNTSSNNSSSSISDGEGLLLEDDSIDLNAPENSSEESVPEILKSIKNTKGGPLLGATGDTTWQDDYTYTLGVDSAGNNIITITECNTETVSIYGTAVIDGITYQTHLGERCFKSGVKTVQIHDGVIFDSLYRLFYGTYIETIYIGNTSVSASAPTSAQEMFANMSNLTDVEIENLASGNITNMQSMFSICRSLHSLDVSGFNTSNVTNMSIMFAGCNKLTALDLSRMNTNKVNNMSYMFQNCSSLASLDVSGFNTSNVTNMNSMFSNCSGLTNLDVSGFDTNNVTNMNQMFQYCSSLTSLDVSGFDTGKVTNMNQMFYNCSGLTNLDVSGFDTGKVTNMNSMFFNCSKLTNMDVSGFDTSKVTNMVNMFSRCSALISLDVSGFNTSNVTDMRSMFYSCSALTSLNVSNFDTHKATSADGMFGDCISLTALDLSSFTLENVSSFYQFFYGCTNLKSVDISNLDTGKATNLKEMFDGCSNLTEISLGPNFKFNGKNPSGTYYISVLPTGTWLRKSTYGTVSEEKYTETELRDNYDGTTMADTYLKIMDITFNPVGGKASFTQIESAFSLPLGELPTATRKGYIFSGWFTKSKGGEQVTSSTKISQTTYYAHWTPIQYTLVFDANGGQGNAPESVTLDYNEAYTLTGGTLNKTGYELIGWNTRANGRGASYALNDSVMKLSSTNNDSITLYAEWKLNGYLITFDSQGGSEIPSRLVDEDSEIGELYSPTKTGYTFMGWYTAQTGGSQISANTVPTADTIYYAQWKPNPTITFDTNGGDTNTLVRVYKYNSTLSPLPTFAKENHVFLGWYTEPEGGSSISSSTRATQDKTYYAHYGMELIFNPMGGAITEPATTDGVTTETPDTFTVISFPTVKKNGYTLSGWYTQSIGGEEVHLNDVINLNEGNTLFAHWEPKNETKVTLTYDPNGGAMETKALSYTEYYSGQKLSGLYTAQKANSKFLGWFTSAEGGEKVNENTVITSDMTVYAHWEPITNITVYFHRNGGSNVRGTSSERTAYDYSTSPSTRYTYTWSTTVPSGKTIQDIPGAYRANYILEGWYPNADGTGEKLTSDTVIDSTRIYYAKWISNRVEETGSELSYIYDASWTNASNVNVDNVNNRLIFHPTSSSGQTASLHIMFELNQALDKTLPVGAVKIRIPKYVFKDWEGNWTGTNNLSSNLPVYPNKRNGMWFSYIDEGEYYTLINSSEMSGGAGVDLTVSYTLSNPTVVPGGAQDKDGYYISGYPYYDETIPVIYTIDTTGDDVPDMSLEKDLYIEMHTKVQTSPTKSSGNVSYDWNTAWGTKPADADDYYYVTWTLGTGLSAATQPYTLAWSEDTVHDGTIVYQNGSQIVTKHPLSALLTAGTEGIELHNEAIMTEEWKSGYENAYRVQASKTVYGPSSASGETVAGEYTNGTFTKYRSSSQYIAGGQEDIIDDNKNVATTWTYKYEGGARQVPSWDNETKTYTAGKRTVVITDGNHGDILYSSGGASEPFIWVPETDNTALGDNDYYWSNITISLGEYDARKSGDYWVNVKQNTDTTQYNDIEVWIRTKGSTNYYLYATRSATTNTGSITLPSNTVGWQVRHSSEFYWTSITINGTMYIKPTNLVKSLVREDVNSGFTSIIKNIGHAEVSDMNGTYMTGTNRTADTDNAIDSACELNISQTNLVVEKTAGTYTNDVTNGKQSVPVTISASNQNNSGRTKKFESGIFYDLLPHGTYVDESTISGTYSGKSYGTFEKTCYDVRFVANWQDSGRTMMIINIGVPKGIEINRIEFQYQLTNTYENVIERGTTIENDVAFANTSPNRTPYNAITSPLSVIAEKEYYSTLNRTHGGYIGYANANANYMAISAFSWGYTKFVSTQDDYEQIGETLPNNEYTYKLTYSQSENAKTDRIVFYDVLEGGTATNASEWQGVLKDINIESIKDIPSGGDTTALCAPVIYYSTKSRDAFETTDYDVTNTSTWSASKPANDADITAVAIDCSKATDGTDFVLLNKKAMSVYLTMQAPSDIGYLGKSTTNEAINYARKAVNGDLTGEATPEYADSTVTLRDADVEIEKTSDPASGTAETPARVEKDDDINYTLAATNNDSKFTLHDIVIEDDIPVGLLVDWDNISIYGNDESKAVNIEVSPRVLMTQNNNHVAFTLTELLPDETIRIKIPTVVTTTKAKLNNTAEITSINGLEKSISSNTTYHEVGPFPVIFNKKAFGTQNYLSGARLQLKNLNGVTIDTWTTTNEGKVIEIPYGVYTLTELTPPENYLVADPITFTVAKDGTITRNSATVNDITMFDHKEYHTYYFEKEWEITESEKGLILDITHAIDDAEEEQLKASKVVSVKGRTGASEATFTATADASGRIPIPTEYANYDTYTFTMISDNGSKQYDFTYEAHTEEPEIPANLTINYSENDKNGNSSIVLSYSGGYTGQTEFVSDEVTFTEVCPTGWRETITTVPSSPTYTITPEGDDYRIVFTNYGERTKSAVGAVETTILEQEIAVEKVWETNEDYIYFNIVDNENGQEGQVESITISAADGTGQSETLDEPTGETHTTRNYNVEKTYTAHVVYKDGSQRDIEINSNPFVRPEITVSFADTNGIKTTKLNAGNNWRNTVMLMNTNAAPTEVTTGDWTYTYDRDAQTGRVTLNNKITRKIAITTINAPKPEGSVATGTKGLPKVIYLLFFIGLASTILLFVRKRQK